MPAKDKTTTFPTWDELTADATVDLDPYQLPLGDIGENKDVVIEIPCPDGARYLQILDGQRRGDTGWILNNLVLNEDDRKMIVSKMVGVPFPIVDLLTSNVIRYYYGLSIEREAKSGNSPGS